MPVSPAAANGSVTWPGDTTAALHPADGRAATTAGVAETDGEVEDRTDGAAEGAALPEPELLQAETSTAPAQPAASRTRFITAGVA